jgi:hypothetical protein
MAKIAFDRVGEAKTRQNKIDGELEFAVAHTWEMLAKLKHDYYATYHNEKPRWRSRGLHTSNI